MRNYIRNTQSPVWLTTYCTVPCWCILHISRPVYSKKSTVSLLIDCCFCLWHLKCCICKATSTADDPSHHSHGLFIKASTPYQTDCNNFLASSNLAPQYPAQTHYTTVQRQTKQHPKQHSAHSLLDAMKLLLATFSNFSIQPLYYTVFYTWNISLALVLLCHTACLISHQKYDLIKSELWQKSASGHI